jgi:LacI family transcriptional regulator
VGLGHRLIGNVAGPQNVSTGHRRHLGFEDAMQAAGLEIDPGHVSFADAFTESEGSRGCAEILGHEPCVTAIVAANDRLAMGCYDTLAAAGLRCPEDVSIVGFNDMPFIDRLQPPLTSVRVPQREIGTTAADLLLAQLGDGEAAAQEILLEPELIVRGSTAPPGNA